MHTMPIRRRTFTASMTALAAGMAAPVLRAQGRLERNKVSLVVDGEAALYHLPLTIADQLGYFKSEGLDLDISDVVGGARSPQAVSGGPVDVYAGAYEQTLTLQARNQYFQAFVLQCRAPQIALGISTRSLPDYRTLVDLKGKRIGVSALGSPGHTVANVVLARAGIHPGEVQFVAVGAGWIAVQALRSGQIDAISNSDPVMAMLEQKGDIRVVADARTLRGTREAMGGGMPAACLYAPLDFIQKNPNTVQALANGMVHGLKWLQTAGPSDIIKIVPESYFLGDRALYLASFNKGREAISLDGMLAEDGARLALKALGSFDVSMGNARIDLSKTYTNEFARNAKERFKA
ncbi:MAG: ABC transporter substrate-binding protein [Burkholderiales bacterium]|jgi:NitT/TauT family transport system substrate-binding protein|nr:ABC transporter substrate-binding protein [Burkholderiales bacterium]